MDRFRFLKVFTALCCGFFITVTGFSQSRSTQPIQVLVSPDKPDWTYEVNEEATFTIRVLQHQVPLDEVEITYAVGPEKNETDGSGEVEIKKRFSDS